LAENIALPRSDPPASKRGDDREFPLTEKEYRYLASVVYELSGIVLGPNKINMVYSRLSRRVRELGLTSFNAYCELIKRPDGAAELGLLVNAITTNLTRFFREPHHFEHLRKDVAPSGRRAARLRIWSAGCSSGEEPYSIAMTLAGAMPDIAGRDVRILATDLDTNMVATAHAGIYPVSAVADMPKGQRARFFERAGGRDEDVVRVVEPIRRLITFKHLNLLGPWPMKGPFDAIFCRNVMIYFDNPTKAALVARYAKLLKPGGCLYIGHSETLLDHHANLRIAGATIYRKADE
jgi:chemotaxis protein methyltransferase CheR